jgi:hypothetical protein
MTSRVQRATTPTASPHFHRSSLCHGRARGSWSSAPMTAPTAPRTTREDRHAGVVRPEVAAVPALVAERRPAHSRGARRPRRRRHRRAAPPGVGARGPRLGRLPPPGAYTRRRYYSGGGLAATHRATTADAPRCATRITSTQPWVPTATPRVSPGRSTLAGELPESFLRT